MKKRGFTLVELLAIIIIIGIIAVITTTAILGIVNDADEAAFEKSIVGLIDSVEYYLWENDIDELPNKCVSIDELGVKNSEQFENGKVCQDDNGNLYVSQLKSTTQELCASGTKDSVRISDDCEKLDDTPPELVDSGIIVSRTTNSITVRVTTNGIIENESSIKSYKYELTGVTDSSISKSSNEIDDTTYSFTGLKSGTYTVKLTVTNGNNLESSIERKIILLDCPTPTITATPTGWQTKKTITINYGENNTCEASYSYSTDGGSTFSEWKNGTGFETSTNGTMIRAKNTDGINTVTSSTFTVSQIDTTGPSASLAINNVTTSKATVTATCTDGQSGITKYEFYNGSTLVEIYNTSATTQSHTYTGLGKESTNNLKVVCINGSGLTRDSSDSATTTTVTPSYAIDKEGWQTSKTVTITYPTVNGETFTNQYKIGTGEWQTVSGNTQSVPFTENGNVTARMLDENNNEFAASTYNVSEIDISSPTCNIEVTGTTGSNSWYTSSTVSINAVGATTGSSNLTVVLKKDGTVVASPYTLSDNTAGTTFSATVTNEAGTSATCDSVTIKKDSSTPGAPTITASDSITSGSWHTSGNAFTLTVAGSSSTSTIDYYLLDASNPPTTERDSVSVSSDTSGTTYYAKACNKAGTCGNNATYVVRRDTCNATVTISGNSTSSSSYSKNNITLTANPGTCTSSVTSYQWYKNNSAISGATSRTYTASDIGSNTYSVRVDYGSGKYATSTTTVYIAVTASDLTYDDTNTGLGCTGSSAHVQCALEKIYNMVK